MPLPKPKTEVKYDKWAGDVVIEGYNDGKYGRSYICEIEGEKTWLNRGKHLTTEIEKGGFYSISIARKEGTKGWYIQKATLIAGSPEPAPNSHPNNEEAYKAGVGASDRLTDREKADGQAKGNYRTGLMAFICTHYQIKSEFPKLTEIDEFNHLIKLGEGSFWKTNKIDTIPADVPGPVPENVPADTKGLIE